MMISNILILFSISFGALLVLLGFMDAWLRAEQQRALRDWFQTAWIRVADTDPLHFALQPLRFLSLLLDRMLGATLSWQAFKRALVLSALLLISLLSFFGILSQTRFAQASTPWGFYSTSASVASNIVNNPKLELNNDSALRTNAVLATIHHRTELLAAHDTWFWNAIYTVFFFFCIIAFGSLLGAISVVVSRQHLRELLEAKGTVTLIAGLALNILLVSLLASFFLAILCVVAIPVIWPLVPVLVSLLRLSLFWSLLTAVVGSMLMWKFATLWLKIIAIVALLPSVCLVFTLVCSAAVLPIRQRVLNGIGSFLLRIVDSKRDPLGFLARTIALPTFALGIIMKICGK